MVAPSLQSRSSETGYETGRTDESFEGNEDELVFSLEVLRMPLYKQSKKTKQKLKMLRKLHSKVDEEFLDKRVKPRFIIIMQDGATMESKNSVKGNQNQPWTVRTHDNTVINLNKYIAKYDYDIASKVCTNNEKRTAKDEESFKKAALYEIL